VQAPPVVAGIESMVPPISPVDALQVGAPAALDVPAGHAVVVPASQLATFAALQLAATDLNSAILALCLADERLTNTIDAKIPMMAITIKSSIRVKPFFFLFVFFFFIFHRLSIFIFYPLSKIITFIIA
jgi:hypothetical protein